MAGLAEPCLTGGEMVNNTVAEVCIYSP